ncbi:hypothetical protein [Bradyrhizobium sp.]|uniref:hypothetical protein n=1 Tax=Bradyrhizobium sp. TaxID=376 RepID=UPI00403827FC
MAKKRVSSVELTWMIVEQMKDDRNFQRGVSVAVIPDSRLGWRAVVEARAQRRMTPRAQRRFAALEKELQESYALSGD